MDFSSPNFKLKLLIAIGFGMLHRWHVSHLFENERHFSHLSQMEREMSFRTEMGLYYSYFKTIAESANIFEGLDKINNDNLSEYPNVINAGSKYNLGPEVNIGILYHTMKRFLPRPICWQIERGDGLSTVTSCEGFGVPIYFYLEFVWLSAAITGATIFLYSAHLSDSINGGLISIVAFFFNHTECTRVQWTPPLRESFAYPLLLFEMYVMSEILKRKEAPKSFFTRIQISLIISLCLEYWQFSQFVFLSQTVVMLILKWLNIIDSKMYSFYCKTHLIGIILTLLFTHNSFLMTSIYLALTTVSMSLSRLSNSLFHVLDPKTITLLEIALTLIGSKIWKLAIASKSDDEHIFNILKSKFSNYKDFHTMLYTCSAEFDFLKYETLETINKTFLLPTVIAAGFLVLYFWYRTLKTQGFPSCVEAHVAYNILQTGVFIVMAMLVMRLKLFMNPHLCILAGLMCSKRYLLKVGIKSKIVRGALVVFLFAMMSFHGIQRLEKEREFVGEYSNAEQEELLEWIQMQTPKNAVFAGKMSLMANVLLTTKRPIVNNPYYENREMRDRTMKVYEIYSRKTVAEVHETLRKLHVNYLIIDEAMCYGLGHWKPGCKMLELWDMVDSGNARKEGKIPVCPMLYRGNAHPFRRVFKNQDYVVLQLNYTKYVNFKPKSVTYVA